ncbi:MAG: hypothetical protein M3198_11120 [Actinomycetota bacterium]|nr:hypothetical protein [Actinomycetota bacterium]
MGDELGMPPGFPYRLQPPLLTIDIGEVRVSLQLEDETQGLWVLGRGPDGVGANPVKGQHGQLVGLGVDEHRALGGWLPRGASAVEVRTPTGDEFPAKIGDQVWLAAAPLREDVTVVFSGMGEGAVYRQAFPACEEPHLRRGPIMRLRLWLQSHRPGALPRGVTSYGRRR